LTLRIPSTLGGPGDDELSWTAVSVDASPDLQQDIRHPLDLVIGPRPASQPAGSALAAARVG
jgi:hypothetical protein